MPSTAVAPLRSIRSLLGTFSAVTEIVPESLARLMALVIFWAIWGAVSPALKLR